jgi:hypothetical protein
MIAMTSMTSNPDSGALPLDGAPDLNEDERLALRRLLRDQERNTWALRQARWIVPVIVSMVIGVYHFIDWLVKHYKP